MNESFAENGSADLQQQNGQMQPTVYYCYDALCGWCYGFSPVIRKLAETYRDAIAFDVLSGGMVMPDQAYPISKMASYVENAYKNVETLTGVQFGQDYLWHIFHPEESDWILNSEKPAVALSILKELHPDRAVEIASDLQYAHMYEGRDLTDNEAYRHLLPKYGIEGPEFFEKLQSEEYLDKAYYDFALVKQLQVTGFPAVLMQVTDSKFFLLSTGYTDLKTMQERIEAVLRQVAEEGAANSVE